MPRSTDTPRVYANLNRAVGTCELPVNRVPGPTIIRDPSQEQVFASSLSSVPDQPKAPRAAGRLQPGIGHPHRDDGKDSKSALGFGSEWNPGPAQTVTVTQAPEFSDLTPSQMH